MDKRLNNSRLPHWMKMQRASGKEYIRVKNIVENNKLNTICTSGNCPNIGECWNDGTATFMILGNICTRACKFCGVPTGKPLPPDPDEAIRLAESISKMGLSHCVITSVDRDDLDDGGASFWANTVRKIKEVNSNVTIETLIPDFDGIHRNIQKVIDEEPDLISHNLETVKRLTSKIRTKAKYSRSLSVIEYISKRGISSKSGIMLGLGESEDEVLATMQDLRNVGCNVLTIGQYLRPTFEHIEVVEYIAPEQFEKFRLIGLEIGFSFVESAALVRSSYRAALHSNMQKFNTTE